MRMRKLLDSGSIIPGEGRDWQEEVPTEPNTMWWFYGWIDVRRRADDRLPDLILVEIWQAGPPDRQFIAYVGGGQFMHPAETHNGVKLMFGRWSRIEPIMVPVFDDLPGVAGSPQGTTQ